MIKLVKASECAEIISERFNIPLYDLIDVFADIPGILVHQADFPKKEGENDAS